MTNIRKAGDALCDAVERGDWDAMQRCAEAWRSIKSAPRKKAEEPSGVNAAANYFLERMSEKGKKLLCSPESVRPYIRKLLTKVSMDDVMLSIDWLVDENPKSQYPLVVLSGRALYEKWDKIQWHMWAVKPKHRSEYF
jgi:hypothetical protein